MQGEAGGGAAREVVGGGEPLAEEALPLAGRERPQVEERPALLGQRRDGDHLLL